MVLRAPVFVSDGYESVKNPALVTHPPRIAEEKGRPKEVYLGVPSVILPRRHRPVTNVPFFGLAVQEEISLALFGDEEEVVEVMDRLKVSISNLWEIECQYGRSGDLCEEVSMKRDSSYSTCVVLQCPKPEYAKMNNNSASCVLRSVGREENLGFKLVDLMARKYPKLDDYTIKKACLMNIRLGIQDKSSAKKRREMGVPPRDN
ncbi:hypothetical protein V6N11_048255 [Hibiscus sabdariffa]|uniref:Uncharacterized protein n=1 Tax=Hibiscus sabdariffa TaxID=183260 RepID=A0ABR2PVE1_9ROSI